MKLSLQPPIDLTYCLNVHPGETWEQQFEAIRENTLAIRDMVTDGRASRRFGLGLRLSALSARQLLDDVALDTFQNFLDEQDLYVFTVNGFPYGQFHQTIVKDRVYKPDWTQASRRKYTETIARVLAELIGEGETASISTAPLTFKGWPDWQQSVTPGLEQLAETAYTFWQLQQQTGRRIVIALEPEPYCYPETTSELLDVFDALRYDVGPATLHQHGVSRAESAKILQQHLGVCFDTAHQAVEFEDLTASLQSLLDADIPIAKVQLSAALEVNPAEVSPDALARFADTTYLHQTYLQLPDGPIVQFVDLSEALEKKNRVEENNVPWRIHYHWPLYQHEAQPGITSTSNLLCGQFAQLLRSGRCPQWEIETYTWNLLPSTSATAPLDIRQGIAQEFQWVLENLGG